MATLRKAIIKPRDYEQKHWAEIQAWKQQEIEKEMSDKFQKGVLSRLGDDDGERLIAAANKFLDMALKVAIPMEEDPD